MKSSEVDILIVPGWQNSGDDHWQTRWERNLRTARRVIQEDWDNPEVSAWGDRMAKFAGGATQPVVVVAHSVGVPAVVYAADKLKRNGVIGAFLVAPADLDYATFWPDTGGRRWPPDKGTGGFDKMPDRRLPFPAHLVVANNDLYCSYARAELLAKQWGATLIDAGESGHINIASGHGPWPDGLLQFGQFLSRLG
ncbi:alpha/beta hydrolase [Hyphomicrobium methylovorum]|uniref:RBBP9/YdeN family alpha/beta hydrolase n=1 Tax=Hyphomicrobium methylovorum TaxID=84 RepID=UPI0015E6AE59|nr:alpha/beta hydrolase [Hyphomicrobium methylovorum]MBA2127341.1 alpha/beta hydrolase [Hyphomicrobium methylovorum]